MLRDFKLKLDDRAGYGFVWGGGGGGVGVNFKQCYNQYYKLSVGLLSWDLDVPVPPVETYGSGSRFGDSTL